MDTATETPAPPAEWMTAGPATRRLLAAVERLREEAERDAEYIRREIPPEEQDEQHIIRGAFVANGPWHPYGRQAVWALRDEASGDADRLLDRVLSQVVNDSSTDLDAVDLLSSIGRGPGRAYLDSVADGLATTVFGVAAAEAGLVTAPDYWVLVGPWRRANWPPNAGLVDRELPARFPGTPTDGEPLHTTSVPFTDVDVDADIAAAEAAGTDRRPRDESATADLWARLGIELPTEHVAADGSRVPVRDPMPAGGLYRRLAATLRSVSARADGNTDWATGPAEAGEQEWPSGRAGAYGDIRPARRGSFRLRWWSYGGCSSTRAWHVEATVAVAADSWLATSTTVEDVALAVTGSDDSVTRYQANTGLSRVLGGMVLRLLARDQVRVLAGAETHRTPWADSPTLGVWAEDAT